MRAQHGWAKQYPSIAILSGLREGAQPTLPHLRNYLLNVHAAAVHLVIETDDRRAVEMPGQAVAEYAAATKLTFENRIDVLHGVELHAGGLLPAAAERAHAALHLVEHPFRLLEHACRAGVAGGGDMVAVIRLAFDRLAAAGDDERFWRAWRWHGVGERVEARLGRRVDLRADIAACHRIDAVLHHAPFDQGLDVDFVERLESFLGERRRRAQFASRKRRDRTPRTPEDFRDPRKTFPERHRIGEPHPFE